MRTEEFHRKETGQKTEGAEKERRSELDWLIKQGEWMKLRGNEMFQGSSLEAKISMAMEAVNVRIGQMERVFYTLLPRHPKDAGVILLHTIKPMRNLNDALAARLAGEFQRDETMSEGVDFVLGIRREDNQASSITIAPIANLKKAA